MRGRQAFFEYPRCIGHELCVTVQEVPEGALNPQNVKPGDICSVEPYLHCGSCIACKQGKTNCCMNIRVMGVHVDGGLRETFHVPTHKLHPVDIEKMPGGKPTVALVETLCIGCHAVNRGAVVKDEFVLVVGAGPVGMATSQFVLADGGQVIAIDVVQPRLDFLKEQINVKHTICITPGDPVEKTIEAITVRAPLPSSVPRAGSEPATEGPRLIVVLGCFCTGDHGRGPAYVRVRGDGQHPLDEGFLQLRLPRRASRLRRPPQARSRLRQPALSLTRDDRDGLAQCPGRGFHEVHRMHPGWPGGSDPLDHTHRTPRECEPPAPPPCSQCCPQC